jgi:tRNA threonylcarbamoyladenosine biosynthesis protein TsaB
MLILAVDTSTRIGSAALLRDSEVLAEVSGYEETPYSTRLFRDIEALREKMAFKMDQIDVFAVAAGPGSFTGLRVGLTAAKAWAEVHRKPIAAISVLEAIAAEAFSVNVLAASRSPTIAPLLIAPFLDARRGQIFAAIYRRSENGQSDLTISTEGSILSPDEFLEIIRGIPEGTVQLVSPTPDVLPANQINAALPGVTVLQISSALAPAIGRLGFERAKRGELVDALRLDANYVRRSDAESSWKDG